MSQEFYFVRHGQTDHNLLEGTEKGDHTGDIPLNSTGREQAIQIEPIVSRLPIQTICASPMKRAQETRDIISARLSVPHYEFSEFTECSAAIWKELVQIGMHTSIPVNGEAGQFIGRVQKGIDRVLILTSPVLIVAHGGIHWAICSLLHIQSHHWAIENCGVVHFFVDEKGQWLAQKLA
jgi:uncharacterized phosphatase